MNEMVEAGGRTAETFGVGKMVGQIYTLLYLKNEALSLAQIAEALQVSKASASIACRQLVAFGALRKVTHDADRRDFYEAVQDFRGLLQNGLLPALEKKLDSARIQIDLCRRLVTGDESPEARNFLGRLDEAEQRREKISALIRNPLIRHLL